MFMSSDHTWLEDVSQSYHWSHVTCVLNHKRPRGLVTNLCWHWQFQRSHFLSHREEAGKTSDTTLQAELSAVSALRQRLQEGVERNQQLHRSLLGHTGRHADQFTSGEYSHWLTHCLTSGECSHWRTHSSYFTSVEWSHWQIHYLISAECTGINMPSISLLVSVHTWLSHLWWVFSLTDCHFWWVFTLSVLVSVHADWLSHFWWVFTLTGCNTSGECSHWLSHFWWVFSLSLLIDSYTSGDVHTDWLSLLVSVHTDWPTASFHVSAHTDLTVTSVTSDRLTSFFDTQMTLTSGECSCCLTHQPSHCW